MGLGSGVGLRGLYGVAVTVGVLEGRGVMVKAGVEVCVEVGVSVMVAVGQADASVVAWLYPLQPVKPAKIRAKSSRSKR